MPSSLRCSIQHRRPRSVRRQCRSNAKTCAYKTCAWQGTPVRGPRALLMQVGSDKFLAAPANCARPRRRTIDVAREEHSRKPGEWPGSGEAAQYEPLAKPRAQRDILVKSPVLE